MVGTTPWDSEKWGGIVIAPSRWRNTNEKTNEAIYEENWILIDV